MKGQPCQSRAGMNRSAIPTLPTAFSTDWFTMHTELRCAATRCERIGGSQTYRLSSAIVPDSHLEALKGLAGVADRDKGFAQDIVMVAEQVDPGEIGMARVEVHL